MISASSDRNIFCVFHCDWCGLNWQLPLRELKGWNVSEHPGDAKKPSRRNTKKQGNKEGERKSSFRISKQLAFITIFHLQYHSAIFIYKIVELFLLWGYCIRVTFYFYVVSCTLGVKYWGSWFNFWDISIFTTSTNIVCFKLSYLN